MNENVDPATMREVQPASPRRPGFAAPTRQRRPWLRLGVAVVLAAAAILIWMRWEQIAPGTVAKKTEAPADKSETPPQTVRAVAAETGQMPITIEALGTVTPLATVTIRTQISGN